jgi:twitching motility protein PilT
MEFSFSARLKEIPSYIQGIDRVSEISSLISSEKTAQFEARAKIEEFLLKMVKMGASDIDFGGMGAGNRVWYRVSGVKRRDPEFDSISHDDATALITSILSERQVDAIMMSHNTDFSYRIIHEGVLYRYRSDAYMDLDYLAINFRLINPKPWDISAFGFTPQILRRFDLAFEKKGLILITGITGSGKSTTLDAIINMNNLKNEAHIIIIGSPIEYFHRSEKCIVRHREVGRDTLSFKDGSVEALRQDPDIIVIGEMRDPETIMTALEITDSGHKVFSTLHTGSAVESIHRIVAECPTEEQNRVRMRLADVLSVVISQKLVPATNGKLVLAKEILTVTDYVAAAIINNNISEIYQMISEGKDHGMITLEQDLFRLFSSGMITMDSAVSYANNKRRITDLMKYYKKM